MAGENLARLVRDRAYRLTLSAATQRHTDGDPEGANVLRDLAKEIASIPIEGTQ